MNLPKTVISDRRAHDRHPFRTEAVLALPDGREVTGRTLDIGKGGAAVVTDINPPLGSSLVIRLRLPAQPQGSTPFEAQALVVNCILAPRDGGFRLGLEFRPLTPAALAALKGYLPS
jgi:c-di-GMP-binding flagellar brake protein YcgR